MIKPTKEQLIKFIEEEGLNVFEFFNDDRTDIINQALTPETYLEDNYEEVLSLYQTKDCEL
jgi:hypothetical protein